MNMEAALWTVKNRIFFSFLLFGKIMMIAFNIYSRMTGWQFQTVDGFVSFFYFNTSPDPLWERNRRTPPQGISGFRDVRPGIRDFTFSLFTGENDLNAFSEIL
jgi:hypothetical protein